MVSLVHYDSSFLELSWQWLNDPEIKRLTHTADFTREDQKKWFDKIPSLEGYKIWGIQYDGEKVGVCGIKKITKDDCEYWGYIGVKTMWSKGIGTIAMELIEEKAAELKLKSIWLLVLEENVRGRKFYEKLGYTKESQEGILIKMRKHIHKHSAISHQHSVKTLNAEL